MRLINKIHLLYLYLLPKIILSKIVGWISRVHLPNSLLKFLIRLYCKTYKLELEEAGKPIEAYPTFNEFFIRKLKTGSRPIDNAPETIVSPVDGFVQEYGVAQAETLVQAKGKDYNLGSLLLDPPLAEQFNNCIYINIYLDPSCYHRIHMPCDGSVQRAIHIPGTKYPVYGFSRTMIPKLYCRNERVISILSGTFGSFIMVKIGALNVGNIPVIYDEELGKKSRPKAGVNIRTYDPPISIKKGEEIARFELGSTVILLFKEGGIELDTLEPNQRVKMGERIGRIVGI